MKTTTNKDMLNAIRNQASEEYKEKVPTVVSEEDARHVERILQNYPSLKNEFINTLTNKVVKTDFFSKVYENPLKMLKKGTLPYGHSIEELFVKAADAKGFFKSGSFAGSAVVQDDAAQLVGHKKANVKALYIERNFAYVYEVSISDAMLKSAFMSANGLSEMVNQLVGSLTSGAEQQEYTDMIRTLKAAANGKYISPATTGTIAETDITSNPAGVEQAMAVKVVDGKPASIAKEIRSLAGRMKFVSDEYNMAKVKTWSRPEDLVFLTTPEIMADLDVNLLAQAFNVSSAEVNVRTILVDSLPEKFAIKNLSQRDKTNAKCYGILMDKDFIQAIDTVNESRQFENGRSLMTNLFLHRQGIVANCYFANAVALVSANPA